MRLRDWRLGKGLSLRQAVALANDAGLKTVNVRVWLFWEKMTREPTREMRLKLYVLTDGAVHPGDYAELPELPKRAA